MKKPATSCKLSTLISLLFLFHLHVNAQETDKSWNLGLFAGAINYQGDLQPSSFTFHQSQPAMGIFVRKPLGSRISFRAGMAIGSLEAADKDNRDYLQPRNLSFKTNIQEINLGLELNVLDLSTKNFSPYLYGAISIFHFNPWTKDENGEKVFLKPLGTEGQGLAQYPDRKPYHLIQPALAFGGGLKFALDDNMNIGIEFSQRKTFTDYLDDVSTTYADYDQLFAARGAQAVSLAYRGDEVPGGSPYPHAGEQRGTPSEMDWFYYFGFTIEMKLSRIPTLFNSRNSPIYTRCPHVNGQ